MLMCHAGEIVRRKWLAGGRATERQVQGSAGSQGGHHAKAGDLAGAEVREGHGRRLPEGGGVAVRRTDQGTEDENVYVPFKDPDASLLLSRCHLEHRLVA